MNVETIKIFCDLVELQNFSRTAEKHGISQSAVSQQLAQLELSHKCQFINRKKRPLVLTRSGEIFYRGCKDILDRYDKLTSDLAVLSKTTTRINVAAIFSIGMHTLQPYVKKFMARYPKVNLIVDYYSAGAIYEKILKGDVDIGIVAVPKQDRNVEIYPFVKEALVLVCSTENALANEIKVNIHKLQGRDFIAFETDVPTRRLIDNIFRQYNITVRTVMEFDNIETIKRAVEIDAGVSILPQTTIGAELANGTLAAMPFTNDNFYRPTGIIIRKNKTLSVAARYLIELLQKNI
jgi:DNA-binding transcriptional LysR family regulator